MTLLRTTPAWNELLYGLLIFALFLFHGSVAWFIYAQLRRKRVAYAGGFYVLFTTLALIDCLNFTWTFICMRLPYYVYLPKELLESGYYGTAMFAIIGYTGVFQFFAHTAIAINRFSVVRWPLKHKMIWSGKRLRYVLTFLVLAPLSGIIARFFTLLRVTLTESGYKIVHDNNTAFLATFGSGLTLSLLTSVTSICFELRTLVLFRRLSTSSRRHYQQDYRLLLFSLLTFTTQLLITIFCVMQLIYLTGGSVVIAQLAQKMYPYISDLSCLGGSPCLFVTSGMVRKDYLEYYSLMKRCINVSWVSSSTLRSSSVQPQAQRMM